MGEDNLYTLHKWKNINELIKKCSIYVYPRAVEGKHVSKPASPLLDQILAEADIKYIDAPLMEISGTFIRDGIKKGKDMSYFLPLPVWKYITEMHFYR
jgi:nicotinate-nucleotide adenylyltransferase